MKDIIKSTKVFAEFMGGKCEYDAPIGWVKNVSGLPIHEPYNDRFNLEHGKYHLSWNWFMPVWIKFKRIYGEWSLTDDNFSRSREFSSIKMAILNGDINRAFTLLASEIEWYNQQQNEHGK